jgi:hypothetical protein
MEELPMPKAIALFAAKCCLRASILMCAILVLPCLAKADNIVTFNATGTFTDNSTLSGTVTIDTTTGAATAMDVTASSPISITFNSYVDSFYSSGDGEYLIEGYDSGAQNELILGVPVSSLIGYGGGALAGVTSTPFDTASEFEPTGGEGTPVPLDTGALTAPGMTTPAPATLTLLGTAMLSFAGLCVWRRRQTLN